MRQAINIQQIEWSFIFSVFILRNRTVISFKGRTVNFYIGAEIQPRMRFSVAKKPFFEVLAVFVQADFIQPKQTTTKLENQRSAFLADERTFQTPRSYLGSSIPKKYFSLFPPNKPACAKCTACAQVANALPSFDKSVVVGAARSQRRPRR